MLPSTQRRVILARRPTGIPEARDFALESAPVPEVRTGCVLVHNDHLSIDPAMRGWVSATANYSEPVAVGGVMRSFATGEVVASGHPDYLVGDRVMGEFGWQEYALVTPSVIWRTVAETDLPPSFSLGVLGLNGLTAWATIERVLRPQATSTVVVSTAAGSVGSIAGQLARHRGCRVVGIAGGPDKVRRCREEFGFDAALDYRAPSFVADLAAATPEGIDAYMDHTAGAITDAVLTRLAVRARVAVVGTASVASWSPWPSGPRVERILLTQRARMEGVLAFDHLDGLEECVTRLADLLRSGRLVHREHFLHGLEAAPGAISMLYRGENSGKLIIALDR